MSADSSNHQPHTPDTPPSKRGWGPIAAVLLGVSAFLVPEVVIYGMQSVLPPLPFSTNVQNFVWFGLFGLLVGAVLFGILRLYKQSFRDIGLGRFTPSFIWKAALGLFAYVVATITISGVVSNLIPIPEQEQAIGFVQPGGIELFLAFAALVLVVPVVEELLFRGFMYKGIRRRFSFATTTIVVSLIFALAHLQLNVALDVFALSLVLCYLREKTNSVWPGILLHSFKNTIAFLLLFVYNVS